MKRFISVILLLATLTLILCSCNENVEVELPEDESANILFLGDDLMESSQVFTYFEKLVELNQKDASVNYVTEEDARLYTYAEKCAQDADFAKLVGEADVIVFVEGTAETATTLDSLQKIITFANDPYLVCLNYYGYPAWMWKQEFKGTLDDICYADSDKYVKKLIAEDEPRIGFEHVYKEDRIHPNELNGYLSALVVYNAIYDVKPDAISHEGLEADQTLINCYASRLDEGEVFTEVEMAELLTYFDEAITKLMKK